MHPYVRQTCTTSRRTVASMGFRPCLSAMIPQNVPPTIMPIKNAVVTQPFMLFVRPKSHSALVMINDSCQAGDGKRVVIVARGSWDDGRLWHGGVSREGTGRRGGQGRPCVQRGRGRRTECATLLSAIPEVWRRPTDSTSTASEALAQPQRHSKI